MPKWFRLASWLVMLAALMVQYFKPQLGPLGVGLLGLGLLVAGVMQFLILLSDRRKTRADDPAQLNLHQ